MNKTAYIHSFVYTDLDADFIIFKFLSRFEWNRSMTRSLLDYAGWKYEGFSPDYCNTLNFEDEELFDYLDECNCSKNYIENEEYNVEVEDVSDTTILSFPSRYPSGLPVVENFKVSLLEEDVSKTDLKFLEYPTVKSLYEDGKLTKETYEENFFRKYWNSDEGVRSVA